MDVSKASPTLLKMTFVGGSGAGKTWLIRILLRGCSRKRFQPFSSDAPRVKCVEFDPSSYHGMEMTETETGQPKDGNMLTEKWQAYQLALCDTSACEDYGARRVLSYTDAAVVAVCFSVAKRETFDMIRTRVRRVYFT